MSAALLLVDLQADFLAAPGLEPRAEVLVERAARLLEGCRRRGIPVAHVWTTVRREDDRRLPHWRSSGRWQCEAGTMGHQPPERLRPVGGERVVEKTGFNPFRGEELQRLLGEWGTDCVWLAGVHLHACVRAAALECLERGFQVCIAEDAVGSNDPAHAAVTRRWLGERCVQFEPVAAMLSDRRSAAGRDWVWRTPRDLDHVAFTVPAGGIEAVAAAVEGAVMAEAQWRRTEWPARCALLECIASRLEAAAGKLARQLAVEIGKPLSESEEEIRRAAATVREVMRRGPAVSRRERTGQVRDAPLGVVAIISSWNNPVAIPLGKIAPALAYGNTVVWKPAPAGTGVARVLMRLIEAAGVPRGAVGLVTGGADAAGRLAAHGEVAAVTLTGSAGAGHALQEICVRRRVPFQAELNGNNAAIVWDGAELASTAAGLAWGAFAFAGQRCTANRRVIVPAHRFEALLAALETAGNALVWGDPLEAATRIGPVITAEKRDALAREIIEVQSSGRANRVVLTHAGEARQDWARQGAYAQPVIFGCDRPEDPLVQEESMGPRLILQRAEDFDHALALCNGVSQGLIASLFGGSPELRARFLEEAQAGVLKFDQTTAGVDVALPFGGWKSSGIGPPEHGEGDRLFYTRPQTIYGAADRE